jgi:hypothetical protein
VERHNAVPFRGSSKGASVGPESSNPDWNSWLLLCWRKEDCFLHLVMFAFVAERFTLPESVDDLQRFVKFLRSYPIITDLAKGLIILALREP